MPDHHPAIAAYPRAPVERRRDTSVDFLGIGTPVEFECRVPGYTLPPDVPRVTPSLPPFDEEYFEWTDLFEAAAEARTFFVMVELGAGYGRWTVRGAVVAGRLGLDFRGLAIEADPDHFRWLKRHCRDNGLGPDHVELLWAAVHAEPGFVPFRAGRADATYGQRVDRIAPGPYPDPRTRARLRARAALGLPPRGGGPDVKGMWMPCLTLLDALAAYPRVDLLDVDLQGLELPVLLTSAGVLDVRVRRLHVGTHSREIEEALRARFSERGWVAVHDYPCHSRAETPYGAIDFVDGVQSWLNPRLDPDRSVSGRHAVSADVEAGAGLPAPGLASLATHVSALGQQLHLLRHRYAKLQEKNDALRQKLAALRQRYLARGPRGTAT